MAATDKTCVPGRWTVLWRIHSLSCLEEFDFNSSAHTASSWCLILLLILKPDSETPHTEFSHLVPGLVFFIGSVTVGSTVWQFQPILLPPENFVLDHWILYAELKLSFAMAATDKTCDPGRWTVLCEIHIFAWSFRIGCEIHCRYGFNMMFNPPTHSETWFWNTRYWVFSFFPSLDFFIGSVTVGSSVRQPQPIVLPPRFLLLIFGLFMKNWSCLLLWLQPRKHAFLVVGLFCGEFIVCLV